MTTNLFCAVLEKHAFTTERTNGEIRIRDTLSPIKLIAVNNGSSCNARKVLRAVIAAARIKRGER